MLISICQEAFRPNTPEENFKKIKAAYKKASAQNADLLVLPSEATIGYNPGDLMEYSDFSRRIVKMQKELVRQTNRQTALAFDTPYALDGSFAPAIVLAYDGCVQQTVSLVNVEDVNDSIISFRGRQIFFAPFREEMLLMLHHPDLLEKLDIAVLVDDHTFILDGEAYRTRLLDSLSEVVPCLVYVCQGGGQETSAMQGASVIYRGGKRCLQLPYFKPQLGFCNLDESFEKPVPSVFPDTPQKEIALIHDALVTVISDYFKHCKTTKAVIGLSGGIDSSVVLPLAVEALGRQNVLGIMMPSQFSADHSVRDAVQEAENLQIYYEIIPIEPIYKAFMKQLKPVFKDLPFGLAEENLQARIRGNLLMAAANKHGAIVLNTSNKSEAVCGYGTLYGDLCGGISVLGDLYKSQVYDLARYINRKKEIIPQNCIDKAPSAELRPNQKDSDSLPPYDTIEKIMRLHLEEKCDEKAIVEKGFDKDVVKRILGMFYRNEYKRRQTPPAIRVTSTSLGSDVDIPM